MSGNEPSSRQPLAIPTPNTGVMGKLLAVPCGYTLEVYYRGRLDTAIALPNKPESIHCQRATPLRIRYTLGNLPRREISQARNRTITLSGRSGLAARQGHDRDGNQFFKPGPVILQEFDAFLQAYTKLCEDQGAQGADRDKNAVSENVYMVFRASDEKIALRVEVQNWVWRRGAERSRFSYEWQLALQGYGFPPKKKNTWLDNLEEFGQVVGDTLDLAAGAIGVAASLATNIRATVDAIIGPAFQALQNIAESVLALRQSVAGLANMPKDYLARFVNAAHTFSNAVEQWKEMQNPFDADTYEPEMRLLRTVWGDAATSSDKAASMCLGLAGGGPDDVASAQQDVHRQRMRISQAQRAQNEESGEVLVYELRPGETLPVLAERFLGSANRWPEIARLNRFQDMTTDEQGNLIEPGALIRLPGDVSPESLGVVPRARSLPELLGIDIYLNQHTADLVKRGQGDIQTITGAANLEQALTNRLLTPQGDLALYPDYGLPITAGERLDSSTAGYVASHVRDQLVTDPRVVEVRNLQVLDEGDFLSCSATLTSIVGGNIEMITPMKAAGH